MYLSVHPSIHPTLYIYIYVSIYTLCLHLWHWCPVRSPSKMLQSPCGTGSQPNLLAMMLFLGTWCRADSTWTRLIQRVPLRGMQRDTNINWKHAVTRFTRLFLWDIFWEIRSLFYASSCLYVCFTTNTHAIMIQPSIHMYIIYKCVTWESGMLYFRSFQIHGLKNNEG